MGHVGPGGHTGGKGDNLRTGTTYSGQGDVYRTRNASRTELTSSGLGHLWDPGDILPIKGSTWGQVRDQRVQMRIILAVVIKFYQEYDTFSAKKEGTE
jgi:hypothetical protein